MNPELKAMIDKARSTQMTPEEKEAQRVSFAYGNTCIKDVRMTRETVARASQILRESQHGAEQPRDH